VGPTATYICFRGWLRGVTIRESALRGLFLIDKAILAESNGSVLRWRPKRTMSASREGAVAVKIRASPSSSRWGTM
jgi:hypothetical protein